jgi:pentatricopeptide repeat protein
MQPSLSPPRIIERARIERQLRRTLETSHVLLTAPAGYGKSVALRSFARSSPRIQLISLTQADLDLAVLQARLKPLLEPDNTVLLDDVHLLADGSDVCAWLQQQLAQPQPRWLLAGRSLPFTPDLLLVSGQVVQLTKELLAFSLPETTVLLAEPEAEAAVWHKRLGGWSLALSLLSRLPATVERLPATESRLFRYLTQAVFAQLSPQLRRFMQQTAVPIQFNESLVAALWDDPAEATELLTAVLQNDLYIQPAQEPGWYRYHDLIRDYLLQQVGEARATVAETAVSWFWEHGERNTAVEQAIDADLTRRAAKLIEQITLASIHGSSSYHTYRRWVRALDEDSLIATPVLLLRLANVIQIMPGYEEEARIYAEQAIDFAKKAGQTDIFLQAQANLAHWYYQRGELKKGEQLIQEVLAHPNCTDYPRLYGLRIASLILSDLGAYHEVLPYFEQAIDLAMARNTQNEPFMNRANLALKYLLPLGKIVAAQQQLEAVLTHFAGMEGWLAQYLIYWCELQLVKGDWDGLAEAVAQLDEMLAQIESQTRHTEVWLAHYKVVLAIVLADEEGVQMALARYDSLAESSQLHQVCVSWLACWHLRCQGMLLEAVERGQKALAQPSQFANYRARLALEVDIAQGLLLLRGELDDFAFQPETLQLIRWRSRVELIRLRALLALLCWHCSDSHWRRHWTAVHRKMRQPAYANLLTQRAPQLGVYFWRLALLIGEKLNEATAVFKQNGRIDLLLPLLNHKETAVRARTATLLANVGNEHAMPALTAVLSTETDNSVRQAMEQGLHVLENWPPPPLTIQLMGEFRLQRGDELIPNGAWHRPIVLRLFQYFVLNAGRPLSKDQILEALWPDRDPAKAWGTFRTVYSRLRKLLEPAMRAKSANRYIVVKGETFLFNAELVKLDVANFEGMVTAVLQSQQPETTSQLSDKLLHALQNYAPLLPSQPYADWLLEPRQKLEELYVEGLLFVAQAYLAQANFGQAIGWGRKAVQAAPWLEEAYQLMMRGYARQGQRSHALRVYEEAVASLRHELDVSPSEQTRWLADRLREGHSI